VVQEEQMERGKRRENERSREGRKSEGERRLTLLSFPVVLPRAFHSRVEREHGDA
jgi:hypothetical protein